MPSPEPRRYPLLGLVAYALVPGERRVQAARHLRRAGVEVLRGVAAFITPQRAAGDAAPEREKIELD
ncbi:MAG TPA: hypothetical protein VFR69_02725 [Rubrobacteraceae bacterium]|nr:hypothetical protein [Rubrobacteraceae bacterium]